MTGTGFTSAETAIKVKYDGKDIKTGITADVKGTWSISFIVPSSIKGDHTVDASGSSTNAGDVPDTVFTVSPSITIESSSGYVGDEIELKGQGFATNESSIKVTIGGKVVESSIDADEMGYWTTTLVIPESVNGERIVDDGDWDEIESMSRPNEAIELKVIRRGDEIELSLKPVESLTALSNAKLDKFGLYVSDITSAIARQLRLESNSGVVVAKIEPDGQAASWDIEPGDIIRQIGRLTISDSKDYFDILDKVDKGDKLTFILERKDAIFYLTVRY